MSNCNQHLNLCKNSIYPKENFWMDDIKELIINNNYTKFFPKYEMTRAEQLNAITRLSIYFIILILIFGKSANWLYLPIAVIVFGVIFYNINKSDDEGKVKEFEKIMNIRQSKKDREQEIEDIELRHDGDKTYDLDIDDKKTDELGREYELQAGYYDSDGVLRVGEKTGPSKYIRGKPESLFTIDELVDYQKNTCQKPTKENPFMNRTIIDYNNDDQPTACNADDDEIKDEMEVNFNHDLFRDVDELWERENSQRQFYTMPNTAVPNNQVEFAKWLYYIPKTCKEDNEKCLRYENIKFKRDPNPI